MKAYKVTRTEQLRDGVERHISAMATGMWQRTYQLDVKTEFTVTTGPGLAFAEYNDAVYFTGGCHHMNELEIWECDVVQAEVQVDNLGHYRKPSMWRDFWMLPYCDYKPEFDGDADWSQMGFIEAPPGTIACKSIKLKRLTQ